MPTEVLIKESLRVLLLAPLMAIAFAVSAIRQHRRPCRHRCCRMGETLPIPQPAQISSRSITSP